MLSIQKILVLGVMAIIAVAMMIGLPLLRESIWGEKGPTYYTSLPYDPVMKAEEEQEVVAAMKIDKSRYDRAGDARYLDEIPRSQAELEAAFRIRKNDKCEKINVGEPMFALESQLMGRDLSRPYSLRAPSLRRPVLSISLGISEADQRSLPQLSKGQILRFLNDTWLSLQARVYLSPETNEYRIHYRPVAAQGSLSSSTRTQSFEATVEKTIEDIRGLGLVEYSEPKAISNAEKATEKAYLVASQKGPEEAGAATETVEQNGESSEAKSADEADSNDLEKPKASVRKQLAVWLFKSFRQIDNDSVATPTYELVFVKLSEASNTSSVDPWELHSICTTDNRTRFHYFGSDTSEKLPKKLDAASLQADIHFTKYSSGGLVPAQSVTRGFKVNALKSYTEAEVESYLKSQGFEGGWQSNIAAAIDGIVGGL